MVTSLCHEPLCPACKRLSSPPPPTNTNDSNKLPTNTPTTTPTNTNDTNTFSPRAPSPCPPLCPRLEAPAPASSHLPAGPATGSHKTAHGLVVKCLGQVAINCHTCQVASTKSNLVWTRKARIIAIQHINHKSNGLSQSTTSLTNFVN
jgi:hypothetical protein